MFFHRMVSRIRAAHALSFAMSAGVAPRATELKAAGLKGLDWLRFRRAR